MNFHPFFRNEKEPVKKRAFYTNYVDVNLPVDIFTHVNTNINEVCVKIGTVPVTVFEIRPQLRFLST